MSFYSSHWVKKTRKHHFCGWCAKRIEPGSTTEYSAGVFDGDFWHHHMHPECVAARDSMTYRELEEGWSPGDFARGRTDDDPTQPPQFSADYRGKTQAPQILS